MNNKKDLYTPTSGIQKRRPSAKFMKKLIVVNATIAVYAGVIFLLYLIFSTGSMGDLQFMFLGMPAFFAACFVLPFNVLYIPFYLMKYRPSFRIIIAGLLGIAVSLSIFASALYPWVKYFAVDASAESAKTRRL